jgi:hypothetical protein
MTACGYLSEQYRGSLGVVRDVGELLARIADYRCIAADRG